MSIEQVKTIEQNNLKVEQLDAGTVKVTAVLNKRKQERFELLLSGTKFEKQDGVFIITDKDYDLKILNLGFNIRIQLKLGEVECGYIDINSQYLYINYCVDCNRMIKTIKQTTLSITKDRLDKLIELLIQIEEIRTQIIEKNTTSRRNKKQRKRNKQQRRRNRKYFI